MVNDKSEAGNKAWKEENVKRDTDPGEEGQFASKSSVNKKKKMDAAFKALNQDGATDAEKKQIAEGEQYAKDHPDDYKETLLKTARHARQAHADMKRRIREVESDARRRDEDQDKKPRARMSNAEVEALITQLRSQVHGKKTISSTTASLGELPGLTAAIIQAKVNNTGLVAAMKWNSLYHPRGADGRFIEKFGFVEGVFEWFTGGGPVGDLEPGDGHSEGRSYGRAQVKEFWVNPLDLDDPYVAVHRNAGGVGSETPKWEIGFAKASQVSTLASPKAEVSKNDLDLIFDPMLEIGVFAGGTSLFLEKN